jgi:hypothetical protein
MHGLDEADVVPVRDDVVGAVVDLDLDGVSLFFIIIF